MNNASLSQQLRQLPAQFLRHRVVIFVVIVAVLYGFLAVRIQTLANIEPDESAVASKSAPARPVIDQATLNKIQQLQDNSVNVRTLFDQARQNPFQE